MEKNIINFLTENLPGLIKKITYIPYLCISIEKNNLIKILELLKTELFFDRLIDITCVDYIGERERFELIYQLHSLSNNIRIFVKTRTKEEIPSVTVLYPVSNWYEREIYDMFGIIFTYHPNLKRILLPEMYNNFPLRKDNNPSRPATIPKEETSQDIFQTMKEGELIINMGPQHPSTHGVLRLLLKTAGEQIIDIYPIIGYLHRGIEKLCETKKFAQIIPITDRLDYVTSAINNLAYVICVEKLINLSVPKRAEYIRVILSELNRIASHLVWLGTQSLDAGAFTPFLYTFREREMILDIFEEYCGSRLTLSCIRIGGVKDDCSKEFVKLVKKFVKLFPYKVDEYETLLTKNKIWLDRTKNVAVLNKTEALAYGVSGPILRAGGINFDLRKNEPYSVYNELDFKVAIAEDGDIYSRYLVRIEELRQSNNIIRQAIDNIPEGKIISEAARFILPDKDKTKLDLASLIHHFYLIIHGFKIENKEAYAAVESPRGELGFYIVTRNSASPSRLRIRTPSFANLQVLPVLFKNNRAMIADLAITIGSLDPVMGEIDR